MIETLKIDQFEDWTNLLRAAGIDIDFDDRRLILRRRNNDIFYERDESLNKEDAIRCIEFLEIYLKNLQKRIKEVKGTHVLEIEYENDPRHFKNDYRIPFSLSCFFIE